MPQNVNRKLACFVAGPPEKVIVRVYDAVTALDEVTRFLIREVTPAAPLSADAERAIKTAIESNRDIVSTLVRHGGLSADTAEKFFTKLTTAIAAQKKKR